MCLWPGLATSALSAEPIRAEDFLPFDPRAAEVGRLLFYDKVLSGNRDISCGTCHHHDLGTGDGLSLGLGQGAEGLGPDRRPLSIRKRIPRNAPPLWNLGHKEIRVLFHDGRLTPSPLFGNQFNSPAEEFLPQGLTSITAAQALFPLTARFEMAGDPEDNEIARAGRRRIHEAWALIAQRVRTLPGYAAPLVEINGLANAEDIQPVHIANALGDFINAEWQSFDSRYDRHLAGEDVLTEAERRGLDLFFGKAGCAGCHSGPLFSDQEFHALALPQFGPGRTRAFDPMPRDVGRMGETDRLEDAYRFRTPMLRNVALTAPYGHNGAYRTLEGIVRHHLDPLSAAWTPAEPILPRVAGIEAGDFMILKDARETARRSQALDIRPVRLTEVEIAEIVAFLGALTGGESVKGRLGRPDRVPSGLPVDRVKTAPSVDKVE